jgi:hypothetical protein
MKVFIRASACISPQKTFNDDFLNDVAQYTGTRLAAIEPDYKEFIDPKQIRRMSRVIKMGVAAAKKCLYDAGVQTPGAIVTGTAFGCLEDTITFLTRMINEREELLPPTAFIQSTHNTVAAQIALSLQCHNYNLTYVHKGISFESALTDGMMLLNEGEAENVLAGATEEMVDASFKVLTRLGLYRRHPASNANLFKERSKGTIGGEGAAFFLLEAKPSVNSIAELTALKVLYKPRNVEASIAAFLRSHSLEINDIGLVITGRNGDIYNDEIYDALGLTLFKDAAVANYKHLCGEYPVSSSFALWLAANMLKHQTVPKVIMEKGMVNAPKKILIYNHYQQKYHSLILVSSIS